MTKVEKTKLQEKCEQLVNKVIKVASKLNWNEKSDIGYTNAYRWICEEENIRITIAYDFHINESPESEYTLILKVQDQTMDMVGYGNCPLRDIYNSAKNAVDKDKINKLSKLDKVLNGV